MTLYIILNVLTSSRFYLHLMCRDYPGVVEIVSKIGVIVKVGGCVVLVGVDPQMVRINSRLGVSVSSVRWLASRIDSFEIEN